MPKGFKKSAQLLVKANDLNNKILKAFAHFMQYEWTYETNHVIELMQDMSPEERDEFDIDNTVLSWQVWLYLYIHGLKRFVIDGEKDDSIQSPALYNHLLWPSKNRRVSVEEESVALYPSLTGEGFVSTDEVYKYIPKGHR